jgi:hypothetical protein
MVKFATLPIVIMAAFVHLAAAADLCTTGLNYCGSDLIQHGNSNPPSLLPPLSLPLSF